VKERACIENAHTGVTETESVRRMCTLHVPTPTPTHTPCNQSHAVCILATATRRVASQTVVSCLQFRLRFREIGQCREGEGKRGREGVWHAVLRCSYPSLSFGTGLHIGCRLHTLKSMYIAMRICMSSYTHEYIYICVNTYIYINTHIRLRCLVFAEPSIFLSQIHEYKTQMYMNTHTHTQYIHTYVRIRVCVHMHMYIPV